jgi:hypothetical protein
VRDGELNDSSTLLTVAGLFVAVLWLTEIAGDPTDGIALFTFALAAPILLGTGLVIAATRRRDIFGNLGLGGAIVVLIASLALGNIGFVGGLLGLLLIAAGVSRTQPRLLFGVGLLAFGALGLALGIEVSNNAYIVFLPLIAVGAGVLALSLRHIGHANS